MSENKKSKNFAKGVHISSNGMVDVVFFKSTYVSMEELQSAVNGHFEFVYLPDNLILVVNEEGKLNNLPINEIATSFVLPIMNDIIVGDVLLIKGKYLN
jgi:Domain of unknown function (DUF3846)